MEEGICQLKRPSDHQNRNETSNKKARTKQKPTGANASSSCAAPPRKSTNGPTTGFRCSECNQVRYDFSKSQKKKARKGEPGKCPTCIKPYTGECTMCQKIRTDFSKDERMKARQGEPVVCIHCIRAVKKKAKTAERQKERQRLQKEREKHQLELKSLLAEPQTCIACGQEKEQHEFSPRQWWQPSAQDGTHEIHHPNYGKVSIKSMEELRSNRTVGKCLSCYPKDQEEMDITRSENQKQLDNMRSHYEKLLKEENVCFYEYPYHMLDENEEKFYTATLPDNLTGEYDVFYHCLTGNDGGIQRTVEGTLTIVQEGNDLRGKMEFSNKEHEVGWTRPNFEFLGLRKDQNVEFSVPHPPDPEECLYGDVTGKIRQLSRRVACRWIPDETELPESFEDGGLVPRFDDAQEAVHYLESLKPNPKTSWLARHLQLEDRIVSLIHEYSREWRPTRPVLFLEPCDLVLDVNWSEHPRDFFSSSFVARCRIG